MWTTADLDAINAAIASGRLRVRFDNQEITYRSMEDLLKARQAIMAFLNLPMTRQHRIFPGTGY